jgi:hypothetical protein
MQLAAFADDTAGMRLLQVSCEMYKHVVRLFDRL